MNAQIQLLEKHLRGASINDERKLSHFSASTATGFSFQCETPQASSFKNDSARLETQFSIHDEYNSFDRCNSSSVSFSSTDWYGTSTAPVERERYVPKYVDVNYIEGSSDKKWSRQDFPWTKKLEVGFLIILAFYF